MVSSLILPLSGKTATTGLLGGYATYFAVEIVFAVTHVSQDDVCRK